MNKVKFIASDPLEDLCLEIIRDLLHKRKESVYSGLQGQDQYVCLSVYQATYILTCKITF